MGKKYLRVELIDGCVSKTIPLTDRSVDQHPQMQTIVVNTWSGEWDFAKDPIRERKEEQNKFSPNPEFDLRVKCMEIALSSPNINDNNIDNYVRIIYKWLDC